MPGLRRCSQDAQTVDDGCSGSAPTAPAPKAMAVPVSGGDRGVVAADDPIGGLKEKVSLCAHASGLLSSSTRGSSGDMPLV